MDFIFLFLRFRVLKLFVKVRGICLNYSCEVNVITDHSILYDFLHRELQLQTAVECFAMQGAEAVSDKVKNLFFIYFDQTAAKQLILVLKSGDYDCIRIKYMNYDIQIRVFAKSL